MSTAVPPSNLSQPNVSLTGLIQAPQKELHIVSQYLKVHEKPIIAVMVLLTVIGFYSKVVNWLYVHDKLKDGQAHEASQAALAQAAAINTSNVQKEAQYQELKAQLDATRAQLNAQISKRDDDTKKQQLADMQLPLTGLQSRWADLLGQEFGPQQGLWVNYTGDATNPNDPNAMLYVRGLAAKDTVAMLEEVPQLKADLKDEKAVVADDTVQIASLGDLNTGLHTQIDSLNKVIVTNNNACEADKTLIRADARKSKLHWFIGGVIVGYIGRMLTSHSTSTVSPTAFGNVSLPL